MTIIPNFQMTPFSQISWVSPEAKNKWEKAIKICSQMVQEMEITSVEKNQRLCAWQTMNRESLPKFSEECAEKGMIVLPVRFVGNFDGFIHYTPKGDSSVYCIISKSHKAALRFKKCFENGDHVGQGEMLGFPKCCSESFAKNWKLGIFDPMWQAAQNCANAKIEHVGNDWVAFGIKNNPFSNPLLRYLGLRVGFHIPCSFDCANTTILAKERLSLAIDQELVKILISLLSMPVSWNAKFGQAVVKTPIFYCINYTVPTIEQYTIELEGDFMPKEAAKGNCFPFVRE